MLQHAYFAFKMRASICFQMLQHAFCVQDASFSECFRMLQRAYFVFKMPATLFPDAAARFFVFKIQVKQDIVVDNYFV